MADTNKSAHTNIRFKDRLFRIIFGAEENKKHLISLYNALNGTDYGEDEAVEITTLDDAIYIRMKNDISFIIASDLSLYEQQSTFNPNMPLRGFLYHGHLYEQYIKKTGQDIFGKKLVKIPNPKYVVFYNGLDEKGDCTELRLSDAFIKPEYGKGFEWTATMLNINQGHSKELMEKCEPLREYSDFIALVRKNQKTEGFDEAVDHAVLAAQRWSCIGGYLYKNRNEVREVLLTEFDEELHDRATYEAGFAEGEARGDARGEAVGETRGKVTVLAELVVNGLISLEDAVLRAGLPEEEFIRQAGKLNIFIQQ